MYGTCVTFLTKLIFLKPLYMVSDLMALQRAADTQHALYHILYDLFCVSYLCWITLLYISASIDFKELKLIRTCSAWIRVCEYILPILSRFNEIMNMNVAKLEREQQGCYERDSVGVIWKMGWGTAKYKGSKSAFPGQRFEFTSPC